MKETTEFVDKEKDIAENQIKLLEIQNSLTTDSDVCIIIIDYYVSDK